MLRPSSLVIAATLILALNISCVVKTSGQFRPSVRGGSHRRFGPPPIRAKGSGRRQNLQRPPQFPRESSQILSRNGDWFKNQIIKRLNSSTIPKPSRNTPVDGTRTPKTSIRNTEFGIIVVNIIETVKVDTESNKTRCPDQQEAGANQASAAPCKPRLNRRAFMADKVKVPCGGPNEAGQTEECYRFHLSTDLTNDTVISRASVLLPADDGEQWNIDDLENAQHSISIVAKFPTSGEGAFSESISAQNMSLNIPSHWQSASLRSGASLISRALREGNKLFLQMSIITESDGNPVTSNYIPNTSNLLPVLIVDIECNDTESSKTSPTRSTHENVVRRLRNRRALDSTVTFGDLDISSVDTTAPSSEPLYELGKKICNGSSGCCSQSVTIHFNRFPDLDWTIVPPQFTTNICSGSCRDRYRSRERQPSIKTVIHNIMNNIRCTNCACCRSCTPTEKRFPLLIITDLDIISADIPIIQDCRCAEDI